MKFIIEILTLTAGVLLTGAVAVHFALLMRDLPDTPRADKAWRSSWIAISVGFATMLTALTLALVHDLSESSKREATQETTYQVKPIKTNSNGLAPTDKKTGKDA